MDIFKSMVNVLNSQKPARKETAVSSVDSSGAPIPQYKLDRTSIPPNREVILSWTTPLRTYKPRSKEFYKRLSSVLLVLCGILILAGQFLFVVLIVAMVVLSYVLSSIPPEKITHEIDNYGLKYLGKQYYWDDFKYYFLTEEAGQKILNIDTKEPYPGRMILLLSDDTADKVQAELAKQIPMREGPQETVFDKALKHVSSKLSLE